VIILKYWGENIEAGDEEVLFYFKIEAVPIIAKRSENR